MAQETVDELTAAGYEAYNVTSANYNAVEDTLQTDLSSLGLDPDSSYIVVVSGEDTSEDNGVAPAAVTLPPQYLSDNIQISLMALTETYLLVLLHHTHIMWSISQHAS